MPSSPVWYVVQSKLPTHSPPAPAGGARAAGRGRRRHNPAEPFAALVNLDVDGIFDGCAVGWLDPIRRQGAIGEDFTVRHNDQRGIGVAVGRQPRLLLFWRAQVFDLC